MYIHDEYFDSNYPLNNSVREVAFIGMFLKLRVCLIYLEIYEVYVTFTTFVILLTTNN